MALNDYVARAFKLSLVIPAKAGGVVHGCTVNGPKDGIQSQPVVIADDLPDWDTAFLDAGLRQHDA